MSTICCIFYYKQQISKSQQICCIYFICNSKVAKRWYKKMEYVNKKQLGEKIKALRTAAGHTQDDLALLLNKQRQVVSYYENGTRMPNLNEVIILARKYNTTTDYLLGLSNTATSDTDIKNICDYTGLDEDTINNLNLILGSDSYPSYGFDEFYQFCTKFVYNIGNNFNEFNFISNLNKFVNIFFEHKKDYNKKKTQNELKQINEEIELYKFKLTKSFNQLLDEFALNYIKNENSKALLNCFNKLNDNSVIKNNEQ